MKVKNGKFFVMLLLLLGLFFVPKVNTTTALTEETHVIVFDDYIEANLGTISTDEFLWIHCTQENSDIIIQIWAMDHTNYNEFIQYGTGIYHEIGYGTGNFTQYFYIGVEDIWHILVFNVDSIHQRTTTINLFLEIGDFGENDGGSGIDAGGYFASALYLEDENYNSSGRLLFWDLIDFYKFYAEVGDHLSIKINGLRFGNTSFILYAPNGLYEKASADYITQDIEIILPVNQSGYWIMKFYKDDYDLVYSHYYFEIKVSPPTVPTSITLATIITSGTSFIIATVVLRKKRKQ